MSEDRIWRLPAARVRQSEVSAAAAAVAQGYAGVAARVEDEGEGDLSVFFTVPGDPSSIHEDEQEDSVCELALYEVDGQMLLCLEWEASDNAWLDDESDQLAEDLAHMLEARPV